MNTQSSQAVIEPPCLLKPETAIFHPGWLVLGIAAMGLFMSGPGQSYSVAAFIDPMLDDLALKRTAYSTAYLVATLISGLTLPLVGRWVDLYGARIMLPVVAFLLGIACCAMSRVEGLIGLYVGFTMIRCLGQGSLTLVSTWLVGEWFERRRGLAMGLCGLGGTLSVMTFPQLNDYLINAYDWRTAWFFMAIAVWVLLVIPGFLFIRNRPEDLGLLPDGVIPKTDAEVEDAYETSSTTNDDSNPELPTLDLATTESWTLRDALHTSAFWKLLGVPATSALVGTGLIFHQVSILAVYGVSRSQALALIAFQATIATIGGPIMGYLTDRSQPRFLLAGSMLCLALALLLLLFLPSAGWIPLYSALLGMSGAVMRSTGNVVWINYYGRLHQGAVRGVALSLSILAAALGPLPLALAQDYQGQYHTALTCFLVLPVIAAIGVWTAKPPVHQSTTSQAQA